MTGCSSFAGSSAAVEARESRKAVAFCVHEGRWGVACRSLAGSCEEGEHD